MVDRDATRQILNELHAGAGEAEPPWLRRDLEVTPLPLHDANLRVSVKRGRKLAQIQIEGSTIRF